MIRLAAVFGLLLAAATTACLDDSITGTRPLTFSLSVNSSTAEVGDTLTFSYEATGTGIFGVILTWGDGAVDTIQAESPNQVERREQVPYAYEMPGSFQVIGQVVTSVGTRGDTVQVEITEGTD